MTKIALIGFGEAAQSMAGGLAREGAVTGLSAYDIRFSDARNAQDLIDRAKDSGTIPCDTIKDAVAGADIVLSLVVGSAAEKVGEEAGRAMTAGQIFIDLNSIGPDAKQRVGAALARGGQADFVEGAVMARVPPLKHRTPILLAGPAAERAASALRAAGMDIEVVGDRIGQACAVKMIRSVVVKGIEALLLESLTAAEKAGVRERILDSISQTFPGVDWRATATYYIGRTQQHGLRRVTEMKEAAATLESLGLTPILSPAISQTIGASHERLRQSGLAHDLDYAAMLQALAGTDSADGTA